MGTGSGPEPAALDEHVADQIAAVEETLARVDEVFGNFNAVDYNEIVKNMTSLEKAKYDLTNLYAINSLFWMYLRSFGEDPKNTSIKEELDRIRQHMIRVSQITNKAKMPRLDKEAANRFVRHELGKSGHTKPPVLPDENWDQEPMETDTMKTTNMINSSSEATKQTELTRKRKRDESESESSSEEDTTDESEDD